MNSTECTVGKRRRNVPGVRSRGLGRPLRWNGSRRTKSKCEPGQWIARRVEFYLIKGSLSADLFITHPAVLDCMWHFDSASMECCYRYRGENIMHTRWRRRFSFLFERERWCNTVRNSSILLEHEDIWSVVRTKRSPWLRFFLGMLFLRRWHSFSKYLSEDVLDRRKKTQSIKSRTNVISRCFSRAIEWHWCLTRETSPFRDNSLGR